MKNVPVSFRFPSTVFSMLNKAGWYPGRRVEQYPRPSDFASFPAADQILSEFSGLVIGTAGPGVMCAAADVEVQADLAEGLHAIIQPMAANIGVHLYPLGMCLNSHIYLFVAENGHVYEFFDELSYLASSFDRALVMRLLGITPDVCEVISDD